ncbi:ferredoxin [Chlorella sorokiniana]|uniref:Ferredoxin n=1 Tax=Chlorella sorokiniana TaxID=3076 RepID=A0A2P6TSB2_CHLSO|nr:ferredoxin [Chlorella sorokiniana]|eukprot:PRW56960.1 ferredoxin [Chlorella sorokiniana]
MLSGFTPLAAGLPRVAVAAACTSLLNTGLLSRGLARGALRQRRKGLTSSAAAPAAASAPEEAAGEAYAAATKQVSLTINGRQVQVPEGSSILTAATALGIHVQTDTPKVKESIRGVLSLLKANHPADCMTCDVNGRCEFQDLTNRYNVDSYMSKKGLPKLRQFSHEWDDEQRAHAEEWHDSSSASITVDFEKCLKCGRCVTACDVVQDMNVLGMQGRGRERHPGVITSALAPSKCISCGQCAVVCPVGAITERSEWREVAEELDAQRKVMVCITAPAVRVAIGEELGLGPGAVTTGQMVEAQRRLGFNYAFDVNFSADLTIMEEGTELLSRLRRAWGLDQGADSGHSGHDSHAPGPLPMFTSCCPGWITTVEKSYPELIPHLSTCKSPAQMMGAVVKRHFASLINKKPEDICLVSVMPCTAKKYEAERGEMRREGEGPDIDYVITTREFGHLLRERHVPLASLPESGFDNPLVGGESTGAGVIFGNTSGVMEAALRTAYELATGQELPRLKVEAIRGLTGIKEATLRLPDSAPNGFAGRELRVAVASGIGHARHLLQRMHEGTAPRYDFVEVMACPGGCIGGGGQPKSDDPLVLLKRMGAVYSIDERSAIRKSHENPSIQKLYKEFLGEPNGPLAHELLHTSYTDRSHTSMPAYFTWERADEPQHPRLQQQEQGEK